MILVKILLAGLGIIIFIINQKIFESGYLLKNGNRLDVAMGMLKRGSTKYYIISLIISCLFILICKLYSELFFQFSIILVILSIHQGRARGKRILLENKPF